MLFVCLLKIRFMHSSVFPQHELLIYKLHSKDKDAVLKCSHCVIRPTQEQLHALLCCNFFRMTIACHNDQRDKLLWMQCVMCKTCNSNSSSNVTFSELCPSSVPKNLL